MSGDCPLVLQIPDWSEWLHVDSPEAENEIIRQHTRTGCPLGPDEFLVRIGNQIGRDLLPKKPGPRKKHRDDNPEIDKAESGPLFR